MLTFLKKNKTLTIIVIISIISFILGIVIAALLDTNTKQEINNNINILASNITNNVNSNINILKKSLIDSNTLLIVIWLLGISIIGVPINTTIYILKVIILSLEITFLILNLKLVSIPFILVYMIPKLINIFLLFILLYYSSNFSIILFNLLFKHREYNMRLIIKRYSKLFIIILLLNTVITILEIIVLPNLLTFLI